MMKKGCPGCPGLLRALAVELNTWQDFFVDLDLERERHESLDIYRRPLTT